MSNSKTDIGRGCTFYNGESEEDAHAKECVGCHKLSSHDWMEDLAAYSEKSDIFEVRFKNTRKGFYRNVNDLPLKKGDVVAVESSPGHDIGIISLVGDMVRLQMKKSGFNAANFEFKKIYRKAKPYDIVKWQEAIALEHSTMIGARQIAADLGLNMKIGDVEYQGDKIKAIFYYIADERVDFRELIKILADRFRIRIEMKQIGARQEAGRIGGIASCGRVMCCSSWVSSFVSVTTNSARFQDISLNPQKLAGQCGKLKCCLNYEVDTYIDAKKRMPKVLAPLETIDGQYHLVKTDILAGKMSFSSDPTSFVNVITIDPDRVREVIKLNRRGIKVEHLVRERKDSLGAIPKDPGYKSAVGEDSITRFDNNSPAKRKRPSSRNKPQGRPQGDRKPREQGEQDKEPRSERPRNQSFKHREPRTDREPRGEKPQNRERVVKGDKVERTERPERKVQPKGEGGDAASRKRRYNNRKPSNKPKPPTT